MKPLKQRLLDYLRRQNGSSVASGELQRLVASRTTYSPQNVGRRLRELENEGKVKVTYIKGHAHYEAVKIEPLVVRPTARLFT